MIGNVVDDTTLSKKQKNTWTCLLQTAVTCLLQTAVVRTETQASLFHGGCKKTFNEGGIRTELLAAARKRGEEYSDTFCKRGEECSDTFCGQPLLILLLLLRSCTLAAVSSWDVVWSSSSWSARKCHRRAKTAGQGTPQTLDSLGSSRMVWHSAHPHLMV